MVLDDEFNTGSLNTSLWSPAWLPQWTWRTAPPCCPPTCRSGPTAWPCSLNANPRAACLVQPANPDDGQPGHTGFQIAPTPGKPVYVEFKATLPATASGTVANWPGLWLVGQTWPEDGEIDVMEGGGGSTAYHIHYGTRRRHGPGQHGQRPLGHPHLRGAVDDHGCHLPLRRGRRRQLDRIHDQPDVLGAWRTPTAAPTPPCSPPPWTCATCGCGTEDSGRGIARWRRPFTPGLRPAP